MFKRWKQAVLLLALGIQISGCAEAVLIGVGAVGGAGAALWAKGRLKEKLDVPLSQAHTATLAALKDLELPVKKDKKDKKAKIESQFTDGKPVWIGIRAVTESSSKITVRVGVLGDLSRSQKILDTIHQHL
jgi:hypothetical protein